MGSLKISALAGAAAVAIATSSALAADLGPPPPPPVPYAEAPIEQVATGWYLRGDVGVGIGKDRGWDYPDLTLQGGRFIFNETGSGAFAGVGVGYKINSWLRVDATAELRGSVKIGAMDVIGDPNNPPFQTNTYDGKIMSTVFMVNAYADLGTWWCLTPYIGAGVGVVNHRMSTVTDIATGFDANGPIVASAIFRAKNTQSFAWALMAGVSYDISPSLKLDIGYRYLNMGKAIAGDFHNPGNPGQVYGPFTVKGIQSHDIKIGMRWMFGANDVACTNCQPKYAEVAPPPPPPPPIIRKY